MNYFNVRRFAIPRRGSPGTRRCRHRQRHTRYSTAPVGRAQAIRRFRALDMSVDDIPAVIDAPDTATRNAAIVAHLDRMQQQLEQTQETVASLRSLLDIEQARTATVVDRLLPPLRPLAIRDRIAFEEAGDWCHAAFAELAAQLDACSLDRSGPDAALYSDDFLKEGLGSVMGIGPARNHRAYANGSVRAGVTPCLACSSCRRLSSLACHLNEPGL
jgi:DNA-binding transcriptional MerR regulator